MKIWLIHIVLTVSLIVNSLGLIAQRNKKIYTDQVYHKRVGVVQLYPLNGSNIPETRPPIIELNQQGQLLLQFDLLEQNASILNARIIHCNADWTQSMLNEIDYLKEYNAFDILDFDYSINTQVLYVNYWFRLPGVKRSGNYVIQVYENNDKRKVLFSRRFVIYENIVSINPTVRVSTNARLRRTHHQVDFSVDYRALGRVNSPMTEFKTIIRQNNRWDNAITTLKPTNLNQAESRIDYRQFDGTNNFWAGNEFRFFDLRTYSVRGLYVATIDRKMNPIHAQLTIGESRAKNVYSRTPDQNGSFIVMTRETGARYLEADYINVTFRLRSEPILDPVYVIGAFNSWSGNENSQMMYDPDSKSYLRTIRLKQGQYDYQYYVGGINTLMFENSFVETLNEYDILIYHRSFTDLADRVVGYTTFRSNF